MNPAKAMITADEFRQLLREGMPSVHALTFEIVTLERGLAVIRLTTGPDDLRPGGTVSGPVLFQLADLVTYAAVLTAVGNMPLAVTTDATVHFLRRPRPGVLIARASLLKEGSRLLVADVRIASEGEESTPVAHAVVTYSVAPDRG